MHVPNFACTALTRSTQVHSTPFDRLAVVQEIAGELLAHLDRIRCNRRAK